MNIGTAKPTVEEMDNVPHFFIGSHSIHDEVTAARFEREALLILEEQFKNHDKIILVGGSGMFIDALCDGLDDIPTSQEEKQRIQQQFEEEGLSPLLEELKFYDKTYYDFVDKKNPMRVMRAVEVIRITGQKYSHLRKSQSKKRPFETHRFVINHDREKLYNRINLRVDLMMEAGLLNEVKSVFPDRHLNALNTVGYKELFLFLEGKCSLPEAIELIKRNSRRYAKRQLTWFRRNKKAIWIDYDTNENMIEEIFRHL